MVHSHDAGHDQQQRPKQPESRGCMDAFSLQRGLGYVMPTTAMPKSNLEVKDEGGRAARGCSIPSPTLKGETKAKEQQWCRPRPLSIETSPRLKIRSASARLLAPPEYPLTKWLSGWTLGYRFTTYLVAYGGSSQKSFVPWS